MESFAEIWNYPLFSLTTGGDVTVSQVVLAVLLVVGGLWLGFLMQRALGRYLGGKGVSPHIIETLTGFKWIMDAALKAEAEGQAFVCGYEEALGYSVGSLVRDKDGISAAVLFADLAADCRNRGETVLDYLARLYDQHGLWASTQKSIVRPGSEGAAQIAAAMERIGALMETFAESFASLHRGYELFGKDMALEVHHERNPLASATTMRAVLQVLLDWNRDSHRAVDDQLPGRHPGAGLEPVAAGAARQPAIG